MSGIIEACIPTPLSQNFLEIADIEACDRGNTGSFLKTSYEWHYRGLRWRENRSVLKYVRIFEPEHNEENAIQRRF